MDALAPTGEEGRGKLRKASGSRKQALIRRYPNGETLPSRGGNSGLNKIGSEGETRGSETSQYPEEKKSTEIPQVVASERGTAQPQLLISARHGVKRPAGTRSSRPDFTGCRSELSSWGLRDPRTGSGDG